MIRLESATTWMTRLVMCSLGLAGSCAAQALELGHYDWRCPIGGTLETGVLFKTRLTAEMYDGHQAFPLDAHVVDQEGTTWPSMVWTRLDRMNINPVRVAAMGRAEVMQELGFTVKKFQVEADSRTGEVSTHNRVIIALGGADFVRRVEVWGGEEPDQLVLLGSGFLVERGPPAPVRQRAVDYPDSRLPLVVIRVFNDLRHPDSRLEWRTTDFVHILRQYDEFDTIALKRLASPESESERNDLVRLYFDTGARNRPLHGLHLAFSEKDIAVPVRVLGRHEPDKDWRWIADGGLHDLGGFHQDRIVLNQADYRYLKVELYVPADRKLKITEATAVAIPHYLLFTPQSNERAYVYFGSARYQLPRSEFVRAMTPEAVHDAREARLSKRQGNPMRVASSLSAYGNTLLRFGLGVVVLLVAIFTIRAIRYRFLK